MTLQRQTIAGMQWTTLSTLAVTVLQLATIVVLTRFLVPDDFGLMSILMIVIGFAQAFMDMGISNAIIQRQSVTHEQLSSLYWLNLASGLVIALIVIAAAPLIAHFYAEPRMTEMLWVLSSVFVIVGLGNQYRVLSQKALEFAFMARIEVAAAAVSFLVAVMLAAQGAGVYALIAAMIAQALVSSMCYLLTGLYRHHRPALLYRHDELKGFFSFGLFQMGEKSINYLSANIDNILIGKFLGMQALGFYNLAWQLCIFPVQKINPIVNKVAFPVYARLQDDPAQLQLYYARFLQAVALITVPLLTFLFYFPAETVRVLYGPGWEQTASLIALLSFVGIFKALGNPAGSVFLALGRADIGFWWNLAWLLTVGAALYAVLISSPHLGSVVWALLFLVAGFGVFWHVLVSRIARISYAAIIIPLLRVLAACFLIGGAAFMMAGLLPHDWIIFKLLAAGGLCLILYSCYIWLFEKPLLRWMMGLEG